MKLSRAKATWKNSGLTIPVRWDRRKILSWQVNSRLVLAGIRMVGVVRDGIQRVAGNLGSDDGAYSRMVLITVLLGLSAGPAPALRRAVNGRTTFPLTEIPRHVS